MIFDIGPILYAILILYTLAGTLFVTLLCTGIWAVRRISKKAKRGDKRTQERAQTQGLPYRTFPQTQNR